MSRNQNTLPLHLARPQTWRKLVSLVAELVDAGRLAVFATAATLPLHAGTPAGTGLFNPGPFLGQGGRQVGIADVNGDGHLDVITGAGTNLVAINNGSGHFTPTGQDFDGATSWALAAGDVNHDGNVDLFLNKDYQMALWFGDGTGTFADSGQRVGFGTIRKAFLADLNADQHLDLVLAFELASNKVYLNDGQGRFTLGGQWLISDVDRSYGGTALDADHDGDLDLVFVGRPTESPAAAPVSLFLNDGRGHFSKADPDFGEPGRQLLAAAAGDMDGDGRTDLVVAGYTYVEVWRNAGGHFVKAQEAMCWAPPWDLALADLDHDGDLDVITAQAAGQASVSETWFNDGTGRLLNSGRHLCCATSFGVAVADLNGDSSPDLVLSGSYGRVWFNQLSPPRITLDSITDGRLSGQVVELELSVWRTYFKAYLAAYVPGKGWSTPQGCEAGPFSPLGEDGRFAVNGMPEAATRLVAVLAPTGANVSHLPCLKNADSLPPELDLLGLARTDIALRKLSASIESEQLVLRWPADPAGPKLEAASDVTGPWSEVTVTSSGEHHVPPAGASAFFRLR